MQRKSTLSLDFMYRLPGDLVLLTRVFRGLEHSSSCSSASCKPPLMATTPKHPLGKVQVRASPEGETVKIIQEPSGLIGVG